MNTDVKTIQARSYGGGGVTPPPEISFWSSVGRILF